MFYSTIHTELFLRVVHERATVNDRLFLKRVSLEWTLTLFAIAKLLLSKHLPRPKRIAGTI